MDIEIIDDFLTDDKFKDRPKTLNVNEIERVRDQNRYQKVIDAYNTLYYYRHAFYIGYTCIRYYLI